MMIVVAELLERLREWASESHDGVCEGPWSKGEPCRHERAKAAIIEVKNAHEDIIRDKKRGHKS